jgi:glycosyltransferase involved in cell wall biosynthesis
MKIGINGRAFNVDSPRGGVQASILLWESLNEHNQHDVVVFGYLDESGEGTSIRDKILQHSQTLGLLWEQTRLPKIVNESDVDLLLCPNGNAPINGTNVPTVVQMHAINALSGFGSLSYEILQRYRVPRMLDNTDAIISVSDFLRSRIHSEMRLDTPHYVVKNGINPIFLNPPNDTYDWLPDEYILFAGGLDRRKNLSRALQAYQKVRETVENPPQFVIVGAEQKILDQSPEANLNVQGVQRLGFIEIDELAAVYHNANVLLYPSLLEWFGLPPIEAMAAGTPVVASEWQCMPEILGESVEYTNPIDIEDMSNSLIRVMNDGDYRRNLVQNGKEIAKEYSLESAVSEMINTLETIYSNQI